MVQAGFRLQTQDVDYTVQLEAVYQEPFNLALRALIRELDINVKPAGLADFIPLPSGWEERNPFLGRYGDLEVFAFDPVSTSLAPTRQHHRSPGILPQLRPVPSSLSERKVGGSPGGVWRRFFAAEWVERSSFGAPGGSFLGRRRLVSTVVLLLFTGFLLYGHRAPLQSTRKCLRFQARQTSDHSPAAAPCPRKENWRKPRTSLMMPITGSTVDLRAL